MVLRVGDENVTLADFEHVFRKNNKDSVTTTDALDAYMELFVNFKLKVLEAEAMGMDTVAAFKKNSMDTATSSPVLTWSTATCWKSWSRKRSSARAWKFAQATSWSAWRPGLSCRHLEGVEPHPNPPRPRRQWG